MTVTFLLLPNRVSLKFSNATERDSFWSTLSKSKRNGFVAAQAAERVGARTIRFYPARAKEGFEWPLSNGAAVSVQVKPAPPVQAPPSPQPATITTSNPFGFSTGKTTKPLPGMTPPPPANMLAPEQPVQQEEPVDQQDEVGNPLPEPPPGIIPHNAATIAAAEAKPLPTAEDDPKPVGLHHATKRMREWRERETARRILRERA